MTRPVAAPCIGRPLADQALDAVGVKVVSIRRAAGQVLAAADDMQLEASDTLVLSGLPELGGSARLREAGLPLYTLVDFAGH